MTADSFQKQLLRVIDEFGRASSVDRVTPERLREFDTAVLSVATDRLAGQAAEFRHAKQLLAGASLFFAALALLSGWVARQTAGSLISRAFLITAIIATTLAFFATAYQALQIRKGQIALSRAQKILVVEMRERKNRLF